MPSAFAPNRGSGMRIVSLLPSATELIVELGLSDFLVGRSHECDHPASIQDRPMLTKPRLDPSKPSRQIHEDVSRLVRDALSIYEVDEAALARLKPTVVITQDQCDVCAVDLQTVERAVARSVGNDVEIVSLRPNSLNDVLQDWVRVGYALGVRPAARRLVGQFRQRMAEQQADPPTARPKVFCLEWIGPPMVAGNWVPELVRAAGGEPVLAHEGQKSPVVAWDAVANADPDIIVVMACGFDIPRTRKELQTLAKNPHWTGLRAIAQGKAFVSDGNAYFNRPGPRTLATLNALAEMIRNQDGPTKGPVWEPIAAPLR